VSMRNFRRSMRNCRVSMRNWILRIERPLGRETSHPVHHLCLNEHE
jgi:hypothetical protein